jgi:hypothetical protein
MDDANQLKFIGRRAVNQHITPCRKAPQSITQLGTTLSEFRMLSQDAKLSVDQVDKRVRG